MLNPIFLDKTCVDDRSQVLVSDRFTPNSSIITMVVKLSEIMRARVSPAMTVRDVAGFLSAD
jgi:hypothetical protein